MRLLLLPVLLLSPAMAVAQTQKSSDVVAFVSIDAPVFVLNHVRVIDGTGAAAKEDQTVVIANGKIQSIGAAASAQIPQGAQVLDRADYTVIPGLVGMHDHLYYTDSIAVAIQEAHLHKLKLTGHLCSVTWPEAVALGIDDLEHGPVFADTEFVADKKPDVCPAGGSSSWAKQDVNAAQVQQLIHDLVSHQVAVTSTLPVFEAGVPGRPKLQPRVLNAMSAESAQSYLTARANVQLDSPMTELLRKEMDFEVAFVRAGGLLLAGPDPTGNGGVLPGFGDQREIELLVEAGLTPAEAIHVATENGALYLGQQDRIGTLSPGKQADLVVIKGDPSKSIDEIEDVETVFKAGIGYDSKKLIDSVRGQVGIR